MLCWKRGYVEYVLKKKKTLRQIISFIICTIIILSGMIKPWIIHAYSSDGVDSPSEIYYRIKVCTDSNDQDQILSLMVVDGNVYAEASELAAIMGYNIDISDDMISVNNRNNTELPFLNCYFFNGKKDVIRNVVTAQGEYEAPFKCIMNDAGAWVPFEYSVYLLNSSMLMMEGFIYIERPHKKVLDLMYEEIINREDFFHKFYNPEYHKEMIIASDASRVINVFDGILSFDPDSWLEYIQGFSGFSTAYDNKYGKEIALLICTMSEKECSDLSDSFKSSSEGFNNASDFSSEILGKFLRNHLGNLNKNKSIAGINWISTLKNKNNSIASANDAYKHLLFTNNRRELAHILGEDLALDVYDSLNVSENSISLEAADYLKLIGGVLEGISYMSQFQNQDSFSKDALKTLLEDTYWRSWHLPNATIDGINSKLEDLNSNIVKYSAYLYLKNNVLNITKDVVNLPELIGSAATAELIFWNISKNIIPFWREGLNTAHYYELASYSYIFQCDALSLYRKKRDKILNDDSIQHVSAEELWPVIQYFYIYLKDAYITREADIGTFNNDQKEDFSAYVQSLVAKNRKISNALMLLKNGTKDNKYYATYGILPSENNKFLTELNDKLILDFIEDYATVVVNNIIPDNAIDDMLPIVNAQVQINRYKDTGIAYNTTVDNENIFWGTIWAFCNSNEYTDYGDITFDNDGCKFVITEAGLNDMAYALFSDYNGKIPDTEFEPNTSISYDHSSKKYAVYPASMHAYNYITKSKPQCNIDGTITISYKYEESYWPDYQSPPEHVFDVTFGINKHVNETAPIPYYYSIHNIKQLDSWEESIFSNTPDEANLAKDEFSEQKNVIDASECFNNMSASDAAKYLGLTKAYRSGDLLIYRRPGTNLDDWETTGLICRSYQKDIVGLWNLTIYDEKISICGARIGMNQTEVNDCLVNDNWHIMSEEFKPLEEMDGSMEYESDYYEFSDYLQVHKENGVVDQITYWVFVD